LYLKVESLYYRTPVVTILNPPGYNSGNGSCAGINVPGIFPRKSGGKEGRKRL